MSHVHSERDRERSHVSQDGKKLTQVITMKVTHEALDLLHLHFYPACIFLLSLGTLKWPNGHCRHKVHNARVHKCRGVRKAHIGLDSVHRWIKPALQSNDLQMDISLHPIAFCKQSTFRLMHNTSMKWRSKVKRAM